MKYLLPLLFSSTCLASGHFSYKQDILRSNQKEHALQSRPEFGLFIEEGTIDSGVGYRSFTGYNYNSWFITEHYAMIIPNEVFRFGIGPGFAANDQGNNRTLKGMIEFRLW